MASLNGPQLCKQYIFLKKCWLTSQDSVVKQ